MLRRTPIARRAVLVLGLTVSVFMTFLLPASADFSDSAGVQTGVTTITVAPPGNVQISVTTCQGVSMQVQVTWTRSYTKGVNGYETTLWLNGQPSTYDTYTPGFFSDSLTVDITKPNGSTSVSASAQVMTLTSYGWTAQSARTPTVSC